MSIIHFFILYGVVGAIHFAASRVCPYTHAHVHGRQISGPVTVAFVTWPYGILFADANTWVVRRDAGRR
jgi:hypothetical protein